MIPWLNTAVVISAFLVSFFLFQFKKRNHVLTGMLVLDGLLAAYYLLSGALLSMAISLVCCARDTVFMGRKKHVLWLILFLLLGLAGIYLTWGSLWSICMLVCGIIATIALWNSSPAQMKKLWIIVSIAQLIYGFFISSVPMMIIQGLSLVSILLFFARTRRGSKKKKRK